MLPKRTAVPLAALALFWNPVPGVETTTPRGELVLKKLAGKALGESNWSGTPSQLISRRPPPKEPATLAFNPPPKSARNASTVAWMAAALAPEALRTTCAEAAPAAAVRTRRPINEARMKPPGAALCRACCGHGPCG